MGTASTMAVDAEALGNAVVSKRADSRLDKAVVVLCAY